MVRKKAIDKIKNLNTTINGFSLNTIGVPERYASIFLIILTTIFTSSGQLFMKLGAAKFRLDWSILMNFHLILGIFLYCLGAIVLIFALKRLNLSFAYPFMSLNFVWVMMLSVFVLGEHVVGLHLMGVLIIIIGVAMMRD